jgi:hypothetical protein
MYNYEQIIPVNTVRTYTPTLGGAYVSIELSILRINYHFIFWFLFPYSSEGWVIVLASKLSQVFIACE